jgi:hypothetical protein
VRRPLILAAALPLLAGCELEFGERAVSAGQPRAVVHAVLNPRATGDFTFVVLVERTLTGEVQTRSVRDPEDPVRSGGGVPISGALVEITDVASGRTARGVEDLLTSDEGKGAGVYRFINISCQLGCPQNAMPIVRGARYRLRITVEGSTDVVEAETTVPMPQLVPDTAPTTRFDRERDTIRLTWPAAERAHRYVLQVQTPYGPFQLFSDTNAITLTGGLRNFLVDRLPLVFTPGFLQSVQIAAVDTNFYDYFRSSSDPFTGAQLINRVRGGLGLFGGYAPIRNSAFEVTAPQEESIEGNFVGGTDRFEIYALGPGLVSGRYNRTASFRYPVLGTRDGDRMRLAVLRNPRVGDTLFVVDAQVVADTLIIRRSGEVFQRLFRLR